MPFAALPSSPGFVQPQAPDWGRFAAQANEFIMKGGEMRAQAGKDLISSLDKSAAQISAVMKYNSPEEKLKRKMEMMKDQAMMQVYQDFQANPDKYQMTAHGPMLKDPFTQALKLTQYNNAQTTGKINTLNLEKGERDKALRSDLDTFRKTYNTYDSSKLTTPPAGGDSHIPPGTTGSTSSTTAAPDTGTGDIPVAQDTNTYGTTGSDTDVNGNPLVDIHGNPINTQ
jgi:hypothetical protein